MQRPAIDVLRRLAGTLDEPTYVYFLDIIKQRCRLLRLAFRACEPLMLFAVKANSCKAVVQTVLSEFDGLECVSLGEVLLALRLGARQVLYTNNNVSPKELATVVELSRTRSPTGVDIWINCDSVQRLSEMPAESEVFVRVNGPLGAGTMRT